MAAFWGFLFALLCVAMFVIGLVCGWALKDCSLKNEKNKPVVNYSRAYGYPIYDPNKAEEIDTARYYSIISNGHTRVRYVTYNRSTNRFTNYRVEDLFDMPRFRREIANTPNAVYKRYFHAGDDVAITVHFISDDENAEAVEIGEGDFYQNADCNNSAIYHYCQETGGMLDDDGNEVDPVELLGEYEVDNLAVTNEPNLYYYVITNGVIHYYDIVITRKDEADGDATDNKTSGD